MIVESYLDQLAQWPRQGLHILAQFDEESVWVYQAFQPSIADYAVAHQRFGGDFSFNRMSWIKPNFLWMMYRSGWASKERQERVLAIRLRRSFFDEILTSSVPSSFQADRFATIALWQQKVAESEVRLQWDPDHDPMGVPQARKAVQLGLRGKMLRRFGEEEPIAIEDMTAFVLEQKNHAFGSFANLMIPRERVLTPNQDAAAAIGLDSLVP